MRHKTITDLDIAIYNIIHEWYSNNGPERVTLEVIKGNLPVSQTSVHHSLRKLHDLGILYTTGKGNWTSYRLTGEMFQAPDRIELPDCGHKFELLCFDQDALHVYCEQCEKEKEDRVTEWVEDGLGELDFFVDDWEFP